MIVHRHLLDFQQVHQGLGDFPLGIVLRLDVPGFSGAVARSRRRRQALAVHLVAREHGQSVHPLEEGRQHIGRQIAADGLDDRFPVELVHVLAERVVGDQFDHAGFRLEGADDRLGDPRHPHDDRFNLRQLDTVAADLDLGVETAEILDLAVAGDAAQIAGPVDPAGGIVGKSEKVRDEGLFGQIGPVDVADGQTDAGDADFPDISLLRQPGFSRRQDQDPVCRQRHADGDGLVRGEQRPGGGDGRFRRAIDVEEGPALAVPPLDKILRAGLAGNQDEPEQRQVVVERGEKRRHAAQRRDPPGFQELGQVVSDQTGSCGGSDQCRSGIQGNPDFLDREVEGDRHALVDAVVRRDAVDFGRALTKLQMAGCSTATPLGLPVEPEV